MINLHRASEEKRNTHENQTIITANRRRLHMDKVALIVSQRMV